MNGDSSTPKRRMLTDLCWRVTGHSSSLGFFASINLRMCHGAELARSVRLGGHEVDHDLTHKRPEVLTTSVDIAG